MIDNLNTRYKPVFVVSISVIGLLMVYARVFLPYLPNHNGTVGNDYSLFMPILLSGYYWYLENGLGSIPWFSPAECGGFPYFPDPQVGYFSIPQFLTFLVSPLQALRLTLLIFATLGFVGCYCFMRRGFQASVPAAVLSASFFMFNGFFVYRFLIGHLTFHSFMLLPFLVWAIIPAPNQAKPERLTQVLMRICLAGLSLAYMFHSGMIHGIPPVLLSIACILLLQAIIHGWSWTPWISLFLAGLVALALSAGKLVAEFALLANFPRDFYTLPGIKGFGSTAWLAFITLFFDVPKNAPRLIVNSPFMIDRHEWEFCVSVSPLLFILAAAVIFIVKTVRTKKPPSLGPKRIGFILVLTLLLLIPIALNWYDTEWNKILKSLPFFGNSSNLLRWFSAYIPIAVLLAGLALDRFPIPYSISGFAKPILAGLGILLMLIMNFETNRYYYSMQSYPVATMETAWKIATARQTPPEIKTIELRNSLAGTGANDGMVNGVSAIMCYQPLMGYRLEKFPVGKLHPGLIFNPDTVIVNMKNPSCYLYPTENQCTPGDHFPATAYNDAQAFTHYKPYIFNKPIKQTLSDALSLITLGSLSIFLGLYILKILARLGGNVYRRTFKVVD